MQPLGIGPAQTGSADMYTFSVIQDCLSINGRPPTLVYSVFAPVTWHSPHDLDIWAWRKYSEDCTRAPKMEFLCQTFQKLRAWVEKTGRCNVVNTIPFARTSLGACSFSVTSPKIWNSASSSVLLQLSWHFLLAPQDSLLPASLYIPLDTSLLALHI